MAPANLPLTRSNLTVTCSEYCGFGDCDEQLPLAVLRSAAGYYVGYCCPCCGPVDRLTEYYATEQEAAYALDQF